MRVAILGVGGLGRTLASELRGDRRVTSLLLVDQLGERARVLTGIPGRVPIEAKQLNVENRVALAKALEGVDVIVNATLPRYNLRIMEAALQVHANYLDIGAMGPREPGDTPGVLDQIAMGAAFETAGLTALVSMGLDPGISNAMARAAVDRFDSIDAIRIRASDVITQPGTGSFPLFSRETFLSNVLARPSVWLDRSLQEREPLSEPEDFAFPLPVGARRTYLVSHEEVATLPRFLGKPIARVDYKYALDANLVRALVALDRLQMLTDTRTIRLGNQMVPFRRALLAAFPEPSALVLPLEGATAMTVEVEGRRGDELLVRRGDVTMRHSESNRRRSTTAAYYLNAVAAAIGLGMIADKATPGPGVHPPEVLDPARIFAEWSHRDLPMTWSERTAPGQVPPPAAATT
ncbi:MAG: saccharopine dehydrogenase NADP-binding domain-containing protein [Thermoplasmata archaeon]|nr:saccharopine dehydrogenase NADP-binding domain-containing protein [Thermoplasmata archaeon]